MKSIEELLKGHIFDLQCTTPVLQGFGTGFAYNPYEDSMAAVLILGVLDEQVEVCVDRDGLRRLIVGLISTNARFDEQLELFRRHNGMAGEGEADED